MSADTPAPVAAQDDADAWPLPTHDIDNACWIARRAPGASAHDDDTDTDE